MLQQVAMKAVITNKAGQVLILREAATHGEGTQRGRYHLPGGRVEPGEHFEAALHREVMEETGLIVTIVQPVYVGEWHPVIKGEERQIVGVYFVCELKDDNDKVVLSTEHDQFAWIDPQKRTDYDIMDPEGTVIDRARSLAS